MPLKENFANYPHCNAHYTSLIFVRDVMPVCMYLFITSNWTINLSMFTKTNNITSLTRNLLKNDFILVNVTTAQFKALYNLQATYIIATVGYTVPSSAMSMLKQDYLCTPGITVKRPSTRVTLFYLQNQLITPWKIKYLFLLKGYKQLISQYM